MRHVLRVITLGLVAVMTSTSAAQQRHWRRLDSPNFIVIGEVGAGELRDIAVKFEAFREVLGRLLNERATSTAVPTVVLVFRGAATYQPFMPKRQGKRVEVGGLFAPRRDVNHITMLSDGIGDDMRIIFHEYAHLLVSNTGMRIPVWLNEGLAEYYSTFELQRGGRDALIGRVPASHLQLLNNTTLLKLPELLSVTHQSPLYNEGTRRSVFYAQAWALTHMILRSEPSRLPQLGAYLEAVSNGRQPTEAWQQAFGSENLERELGIYIRRQAYTATLYRFTDKLATFEAQATPVSPADIEAFLAGYLVQTGELGDAGARLATGAKFDSSNQRLGIVNAQLSLAQRDFATAEKLAREIGDSTDWYLNYAAGVTLAAALEARARSTTPEDVGLVRQFFARAHAVRPEFANALARLGWIELRSAAGPTTETRATLERARAIAPGRHEYSFLLAQVLARQSEFEAARNLLGPLLSPYHLQGVRDQARQLMEYVVNLEAARAGRPSAGGGATTKTFLVPTDSKPAAVEEPKAKPLFRDLKPGEQRFEGILERIDCVVGKGVTFIARSGAEMLAVTSPDLTSVDFITYRNDLKGSVTCGPIKPPMPVYVTWRAGATPTSKIAVAIEFLPK